MQLKNYITDPRLGVLLLGLALPLAGGCERRAEDAGKPLVVATTTMIGDIVRELAGDRVDLHTLMKPGVDPHVYEPRPDDGILIKRARLVLYNGHHLEGRMIELFHDAGDRAVALAEDERIATRKGGGSDIADPHCWWNAQYFAVYVERAAAALARCDPPGAAQYAERAAAYRARLLDLDGRVRAAIARIPEQHRYLITSHDAFFYYGQTYGLTVDSVLGTSTDAQARALRINELADIVMAHGVPTIFHETSVSAALNDMIDRVVAVCAQRGHKVQVSSTPLYSDSLDRPETDAGTYVGALLANTRSIVAGLAGDAAPAALAELEGKP